MRFWKLVFSLSLPATLSACATLSPVAGTFPSITPHQAQTGAENGKLVRWGGEIIHTQPKSSQTCFTVLAFPLTRNGRPQLGRQAGDLGRFIACSPGFYDPTLYAPGREITLIGSVAGIKKEKVGAYEYPYPLLSSSTVYLWPITKPQLVQSTVFVNSDWWWGGPLGWGWWGFPYG